MSRLARSLAWSLALFLSSIACRVEADDLREGVDRYQSGEARVTVEWFAPAAQGKFPAILLLHGSGGLDPGTAQVFRAIARDFTQRGYVVLIPHYFERTDHIVGRPFESKELKAFMEAVEDAISFAVASGIVAEDRIGMVGYSMGAYFAFSRAPKDTRIKAIVSCSGSLPVQSSAKFPPVLILQGSADRGNPLANVKKFQEVLKEKGTPSANHVYKGMGHNFDVERWEDAAGRAAAFFDKHLGIPRDAKAKKSRRGKVRKDSVPGTSPPSDGEERAKGPVGEPGPDDDGSSPGRPDRKDEGPGGLDPGTPKGSEDRSPTGESGSEAGRTGSQPGVTHRSPAVSVRGG
jgi:dienelactone hydrolase